MGGGVVHVGCQPDHVLDARALDLAQQAGDFDLAAQGLAVVAVGNCLPFVAAFGILAVRDVQADGHIGGDHFPHSFGCLQAIQQPVYLRAAHEGAVRGFGGLQVGAVRTAVAAHVHHKHVQQRALGQVAVDALALNIGGAAQGGVFVESLGTVGGEQGHVFLGVAGIAAQVFGV